MSELCCLCPRRCGAHRAVQPGVCGQTDTLRVSRAAAHFWEEPCISGVSGSGAIFFSGCNLKCVFCQNAKISSGGFGKEISVKRLKEIYYELIDFGVHNINLVTPTHFADKIAESLDEKLPVPVIWNSGGYDSVDTLKMVEGKIDIYMPDYKYSDPHLAAEYSGAPDYPAVTSAAIAEMFRQRGKYRLDGDGMMLSGVLIRHLILPGAVDNTLGAIDYVSSAFRPGDVLFSLMRQYTPPADECRYPVLNRRVSDEEYSRCEDYMYLCGIEDGFVQDSGCAESEYTPPFNLEGV